MKKTGFSFAAVSILIICILFSALAGLKLIAPHKTAVGTELSAIPEAGGRALFWLGIALVIIAAGIIIYAASRRKK